MDHRVALCALLCAFEEAAAQRPWGPHGCWEFPVRLPPHLASGPIWRDPGQAALRIPPDSAILLASCLLGGGMMAIGLRQLEQFVEAATVKLEKSVRRSDPMAPLLFIGIRSGAGIEVSWSRLECSPERVPELVESILADGVEGIVGVAHEALMTLLPGRRARPWRA